MTGDTPQDAAAEDACPDGADISDGDLLRVISQKDNPDSSRSAWAAFYERHASYLYAICKRSYGHKLGDAGVEDLVSETFLRVYKTGAASFTPGNLTDPDQKRHQVRAWLATIAEHLAFDRLRGRKKEAEIHLGQSEWQDITQGSGAPATELLVTLCHIIQTLLNVKEQDVIRTTYLWNAPGRDYQKLPPSELAALAKRCETTPENIRKIRERAMKKLKAALEPVMARFTGRTQSDD